MKKLLLMLLALSALTACLNETVNRPNIIFITIDTLRWDYLSTYGYPEAGISPAADRIAASGTVFDNAVATAGSTIPSHGSMLTGVYARMHGARSNFHGKYPGIPTITPDLVEAGYQTGAFVSNQFLINVGLLGEGFETDNLPFKDSERGGRPQTGDKTVAQATEWLDSLDPGRPAFMWLHLWEPHGPYDPTDWSTERLDEYEGFLKDGVTLDHIRKETGRINEQEAHVEAMRTHYAGEVNLADQHLGQLLDHMQATGWLDNTLIIFTADHGQSLGENKRMGHGPTHRETVIRVPLIIADLRQPAARRVATRVSVIDVAPTIADAAGLERTFDYAGRSLLRPEELGDDWPYFAEVVIRQETDANWERTKSSTTYDPKALAVYTGPLKMTYQHGRYRLFETGYELLAAREIELASEPVMADYMQGLIDSFQELQLDITADEVAEEDLRILQGLGYTQ
jgi:arylsulfatase